MTYLSLKNANKIYPSFHRITQELTNEEVSHLFQRFSIRKYNQFNYEFISNFNSKNSNNNLSNLNNFKKSNATYSHENGHDRYFSTTKINNLWDFFKRKNQDNTSKNEQNENSNNQYDQKTDSKYENDNNEKEESEKNDQKQNVEEKKLRNAFRELLAKRMQNENIYEFDEVSFSKTISLATLPRDLAMYKTQEELIAVRDVMDLHLKHISKEKALNIYYKFYRSSPQFQPSYKTFRYLFYKWRASPITIQTLEADFDALCQREPDDINGIRSVLNVIMLSQRLFGYNIDLRAFFAKSHGTDIESSVIWDTGKLMEWMPYDGEELPVSEAIRGKQWVEDMEGYVFKEGLYPEVADWRRFVNRRGGIANKDTK